MNSDLFGPQVSVLFDTFQGPDYYQSFHDFFINVLGFHQFELKTSQNPKRIGLSHPKFIRGQLELFVEVIVAKKMTTNRPVRHKPTSRQQADITRSSRPTIEVMNVNSVMLQNVFHAIHGNGDPTAQKLDLFNLC